ncbi:basic amino acid/polyamine antiporter [Clostridium tarantellae]|uniref:Amino acid permease n=1 Tax=Clostridium tarantellae TaxID=39493 RepID=A0A6I1MMD1_9CLOT|nr:basic amino acid/polyamine antiporter [Clostridium tarantellae]MPQ44656.1 amino acid permease [Clostridium tarantellae]
MRKVGLFGLIAIVIGSMLGGGIFNLPGEMAQNAVAGASIIAWLITGIGVFFIAKVFQVLSFERGDITSGIYYYAKEGFGNYIGFNSAWGYWLSNAIGNVSFAILFVDALTKFFPAIKGSNGLIGTIISTILIWAVVLLVAKGMKTATAFNNIATIAKIVPIIIAIFLLFVSFKMHIFTKNLWVTNITMDGLTLGSISSQIKDAMLQTLWVFVGVEGAVVISGRAKNSRDVGIATIIGYVFVLICYVLIVELSYGSVPQENLMAFKDPSLAGVLKYTYGNWADILIDIGVIISVLGAWVSWTILTAEIPLAVAEDKMFPKFLAKVNKENAAIAALIFNAAIMQITYFFAMFANNAFEAITNVATEMVLIPYVLSALFLVKISYEDKKWRNFIYGICGTIYSLFMIFTSGLMNLLECTSLYALGIIFLIITTHEQGSKMFNHKWEKYFCYVLTIVGIAAIFIMKFK